VELKTTYGYTVTLSKNYLTSVTNPLSQVTNYTNANFGMTCVKPPGFATCTMTLSNHTDRIATQTLQDGGSWITSGMSPDVLNNPDASYDGDCTNETAITDPNGVVMSLTFTKTSPCSMTDALGNTTLFRYEGAHQNNDTEGVYSDGGFLKEAVFPEGNKYQAEYLGPFRAVSKETMVPKPGSPLGNLVKQYGYGNSCTTPPGSYQNCAKPTWIKDPKLNQTDFTYATHGGVLTEMQPAPIASASRPLKVYSYVSKYAYVKNSGGALVQAATPVWMVNTLTQCQTVAGANNGIPTCDTAVGAPQTVTTYQYGADGTANNLLVRGTTVTAGGESRRTCYGYDPYAREISETKPNANLSVCP
jgi:phage baseplate assembly protein gpV